MSRWPTKTQSTALVSRMATSVGLLLDCVVLNGPCIHVKSKRLAYVPSMHVHELAKE